MKDFIKLFQLLDSSFIFIIKFNKGRQLITSLLKECLWSHRNRILEINSFEALQNNFSSYFWRLEKDWSILKLSDFPNPSSLRYYLNSFPTDYSRQTRVEWRRVWKMVTWENFRVISILEKTFFFKYSRNFMKIVIFYFSWKNFSKEFFLSL